MEAIDFSNGPAWLIVVGLLLNFLKVPLSKAFPALSGVLVRTSEAKLEAVAYERARVSWHEDKTFELLEDTLRFLREDRKASREDAKSQLEQNQGILKAINRQTASVEQWASITRILSQNAAKTDDRLGDISQSVARTYDKVSRIEKQIDKAVTMIEIAATDPLTVRALRDALEGAADLRKRSTGS